MTIYVAVSRDYSIKKLNSIEEVISHCKNYCLSNGLKVEFKYVCSLGGFFVYDFDDKKRKMAQEGFFISDPWIIKIERLT